MPRVGRHQRGTRADESAMARQACSACGQTEARLAPAEARTARRTTGPSYAGCHASVTSCLETRPQPLDRVRLSPAARLMEMAHPPCALYVVPPDKVAAQRIVPARKGLRR